MIRKIFWKEWREKIHILLFGLGLIVLFVVVFFKYRNQMAILGLLSGGMILIFLPLSAVLIGSSGFYSEFKDNAWTYLFSRPIKKWQIWLVKYFSLISILLVIYVFFFVAIQIFPFIKNTMNDPNYSLALETNVAAFLIYFLFALLALSIAYSISFLSEKQFLIFFVLLSLGFGLGFLYQRYIAFLWMLQIYVGDIKAFPFFIGLSFVAASIITFVKTDFSQTIRKNFMFIKLLLLFVVLSMGIITLWSLTKGSRSSAYYFEKYAGDVYFVSRGGIFKYRSEEDKIEVVRGGRQILYQRPSVRGGKIAFVKYKGRQLEDEELWVMGSDGTLPKRLTGGNLVKDSPLYNSSISSNFLSTDGNKIAFTTEALNDSVKEFEPALWVMNTNGTRSKRFSLEFLHGFDCRIVAWPGSGENLFILFPSRRSRTAVGGIAKFNLEEGIHQILAESVNKPAKLRISPDQGSMTFCYRDVMADKEIFSIMDLKTLEKTEIYRADFIKLGEQMWSRNNRKLVYFIENVLWEYSVLDKKITRIREYDIPSQISLNSLFDWFDSDRKLVLYIPSPGQQYLRILGGNYKEVKKIELPSITRLYDLVSLDKIALVKGYKIIKGKYPRRKLWRVDLETGEWKKLM